MSVSIYKEFGIFLVALSILLLLTCKEAGAQSAGAKSLRLKKTDILDAQGFGRVIPAASVLIPAGWKSSGGIVWKINPRGCGRNGTSVEWSAESADGSTRISLLPEQTWSGNNLGAANSGACPNVWINSAKEYLQAFVQENRAGARVLEFRPRADIAQKYAHLHKVVPTAVGEIKTWVDAGEVHLSFTENGKEKEEILVMMITFQMSSMQGIYPGEIRRFLNIASAPGFSMQAPRGKLDRKLAETIRSSGKPYPAWSRLMAQHQAKMTRISQKGAADRHRIRMQTNREIAAMNQKSYENRQASQDRSHKRYIQSIQEVENYKEADSGTQVELPSTYNHAWKLDDGTYVLTDDANFEAYRDLGIGGSEMQRVE